MSDPTRILLIEDDAVDRKAFQRLVERERLAYQFSTAANLRQAQQFLSEADFDIILADFHLGEATALDILAASGEIPVIVVTGAGDEDTAVQAMKAGAYDYLVKDPAGNYLRMLPLVIEKTLQRREMERLNREHSNRMAATAERQRIARELHDSLSQKLFTISLLSETLPRIIHTQPDRAEALARDLQAISHEAQTEIRTLLNTLRLETIGSQSLTEVIRQFIQFNTHTTGLAAEFHQEGRIALPATIEEAACYIAREAFYNIQRHARASTVSIRLRQDNGLFELHIRDNGQGFDPLTVKHGHFGMAIMRERSAAAGLVLDIRSLPGAGTEVMLTWRDRR